MKRIHRTMLTAAVVLTGGAIAGVIALRENKTPEERFLEKQNKKRLFSGFGFKDVTSAELMAKGATIAFSLDSEKGWKIERPVKWPADLEATRAAINHLVAMLVEAPLEEADIPKVGLDKPTVRFKVRTKDKGEHLLLVGPRNELVNRYPVSNGKRLGMAEAAFYWSLDRPVDDFRSKRLFRFSPKSVTKLKVLKADQPLYVLERKAKTWGVSKDGTDPKLGDRGLINLMLVGLTKRLTVERFVTDSFKNTPEQQKEYQLAPPRFQIELTTKKGTYIARLGGLRETAAEEPTIILHQKDSTTVVEVGAWIEKELDKSPEALRDLSITRFDRHDVKKVHLNYAGSPKIVLERSADGSDWNITAPKKAPAKPWKVDDLVRVFSALKSNKVHKRSPKPKDLFDWLLKPPSRRLQFYDGKGTLLGDVSIGTYATETELFAMATGSSRVDILDQKRLVILPTNLEDLIDKDRVAN